VQPRAAVPLAQLTTVRVGGAAAHFVEALTESDLVQALAWAEQRGVPCRILGGGSNVVVADGGFDGLVIQIANRGVHAEVRGDTAHVEAAAGEIWDELVAHTVREGWAGLECLSGIPGRVGSTPIQNVGAYGQEVADTIQSVRAFDRRDRQVVDLPAAACDLGYRDSRFKSGAPDRYVVLSVRFRLRPGGAPTLRYAQLADRVGPSPSVAEVREVVLAIRREKSMLLDPDGENGRSCGSFFVNPVVARELLPGPNAPCYPQPDGRIKLAAGWLIEQAGFRKGERHGAVGLSTHHALALVCHDGASAADLVRLAARIRDAVQARFGIRLRPEPAFWGFAEIDAGLPSLDARVQ
jgi:UDP-N-acetylmuramate dehydrogenase